MSLNNSYHNRVDSLAVVLETVKSGLADQILQFHVDGSFSALPVIFSAIQSQLIQTSFNDSLAKLKS